MQYQDILYLQTNSNCVRYIKRNLPHSIQHTNHRSYAGDVSYDDENLIHLGDYQKDELYKSKYGRKFKEVLCHEIVHASMFSYNIYLDYDTEEFIANLISKYGEEIKRLFNVEVVVPTKPFPRIKLEELYKILEEKYGVSVLRMDADTTTKKGSHEKYINMISNHEVDIIIGTQMISKGLDFKNVTLVGVIAADTSMNIDDYRADERTFDLLVQVAGRAGRENEKGKVIVQTYNPENFAIECSQKQDYDIFYETEIELRKQLKYPPFCDIISIGLTDTDENKIKNVSEKLYKVINEYLKKENLDKIKENLQILRIHSSLLLHFSVFFDIIKHTANKP